MARSEAGLPDREDHPAGYRIVRVPVSAVAGLPWPLRPLVVGWRRRRPGGARAPGAAAAVSPSGEASPSGVGRRRLRRSYPPRDLGRRPACGDRPDHPIAASRVTTARAARRPRPRDGLHGHPDRARPGPPRSGRRSSTTPATSTSTPRNIARLPAFARRLFGAIERRWARAAARVVTVNRPYAEVMQRSFGGPLPAIVMNCSFRRPPPAADAPRRFHSRARPRAGRPGRPLPRRPRAGSRHRAADRRAAGCSRRTSTCACSATARSRQSSRRAAGRPEHGGPPPRPAGGPARRAPRLGRLPRTSSRCRSSPRR